MPPSPKVSVITPSLNQGEFIERTILSVLNQDYKNIEYIVIDGGSSDDTLKILKKYSQKLIWRSEPDKGQANAINKGLKMATGDIFAYLNSDDTYKKDAVSIAVKYFNQHPEVGLVYGNCDMIDEHDSKIGTFIGIPVSYRKMLLTNIACIPQQTAFWKKEIHTDIGFFDEALDHAIDTDFFIRVIKTHKAFYIRDNYATFRWHSMSKSAIEYRKDIRMPFNKFKVERAVILRKHGIQYLTYFIFRYRILPKIKNTIFPSKKNFKKSEGCINFFRSYNDRG